MLATRLLVSTLIFVGFGVCPGLARAAPPEVAPEEEESAPSAKADKAAGSHFLLEGSAGFSVAGANGITWGGMLGAGGRVPASPLRLYLVGELAQSSSERQRTSDGRTE